MVFLYFNFKIFFFFFLVDAETIFDYYSRIFEGCEDNVFNVPLYSELYLDFRKRRRVYMRKCYYRIITELLLHERCFQNYIVVLGNAGIGKSVLSYLFIYCLLSLDVKVCQYFIFLKYNYL
jgi:hypothetical protein